MYTKFQTTWMQFIFVDMARNTFRLVRKSVQYRVFWIPLAVECWRSVDCARDYCTDADKTNFSTNKQRSAVFTWTKQLTECVHTWHCLFHNSQTGKTPKSSFSLARCFATLVISLHIPPKSLEAFFFSDAFGCNLV